MNETGHTIINIPSPHKRWHLFLLLLIFFLFLFISCSSTTSLLHEPTSAFESSIVTGSIIWPGTYPYTQGSVVVDIALESINPMTGEVLEIAHQRIRSPQRFPVNFTLRYDRADILPAFRYRITAAVSRTADAPPFLVTASNIWVITGNNPSRSLELLLTE